jgi:hypothetical protein
MYGSIGKSKIRVVHNVANGPEVDGYLDGKLVLRTVAYKAISDYLEVNSGKHVVTVKIAGTDKSIVHGEVTLTPGMAYTLIVHGLISDPKTISPLLVDDNLACPVPGKAHVRFIHAAAGAPAVDIYSGHVRIFGNVSYGHAGNPEYLPVHSGHINVSVKTAAAVNIRSDVVTVVGPLPLRLESGGIYTIIASGIVGDSKCPLTALVSEDSKGSCVVTHL